MQWHGWFFLTGQIFPLGKGRVRHLCEKRWFVWHRSFFIFPFMEWNWNLPSSFTFCSKIKLHLHAPIYYVIMPSLPAQCIDSFTQSDQTNKLRFLFSSKVLTPSSLANVLLRQHPQYSHKDLLSHLSQVPLTLGSQGQQWLRETGTHLLLQGKAQCISLQNSNVTLILCGLSRFYRPILACLGHVCKTDSIKEQAGLQKNY